MRPAILVCLLLLAPRADAAAPVAFRITDAKGQPVADAVVSLVPLIPSDQIPPPTPPATPLEIVQRGQEFLPYVTPLFAGTAVSFPNRDNVQHHVYSLSPPKKFELPLYAGEAKAPVVFDHPGVVALGCNIHDWMSAYIVVLATPWFAKTGPDGAATVSGASAGTYRAEVWHPRLARVETREIVVADEAAAPIAFTLKLKPDRRIRRHAVLNGSGY